MQVDFDVFFKDEKIGTLRATETVHADESVKELKSETEAKLLFISFHFESDVTTINKNNVLISGTAFRESNHGPGNIQAKVTKTGISQYERTQNGVSEKFRHPPIKFCVIDLYFREPVGIKKIFSNMYTQMLSIKKLGGGKYLLSTPDNNTSIYIYDKKKLVRIELATKVGNVISKRTRP